MLTREAVEEFKKLYKEHFDTELSDEEAHARARALINLYRAVCIGSKK
jgi:hypothetical protein